MYLYIYQDNCITISFIFHIIDSICIIKRILPEYKLTCICLEKIFINTN